MVMASHCLIRCGRSSFAPLAVAFALFAAMAARGDGGVVVNAAGDIARCGAPGAERTAELLDRLDGAILALGDLAYKRGSHEEFRTCYAPTWGRHKARTWPVPGNHEYRTKGAVGYFDYWGARAGTPGEGYYSLDLGAWHVVALNSSIDARTGSAQDAWLAADLAATQARCILAFWHHPVFSSGRHGDDPKMRDLARRLYMSGASVVLSGHDHVYERFTPQDPDGRADPAHGIRMFTVGTGGADLYAFDKISDNSEVRFNDAWGVLRLELESDGYRWTFVAVDGGEIDSGRADCVPRPR